MTVYDIASLTELFTIYLAYRHIFTSNICAWLPSSSPFPGAVGGFTTANLRFWAHFSRLTCMYSITYLSCCVCPYFMPDSTL